MIFRNLLFAFLTLHNGIARVLGQFRVLAADLLLPELLLFSLFTLSRLLFRHSNANATQKLLKWGYVIVSTCPFVFHS